MLRPVVIVIRIQMNPTRNNSSVGLPGGAGGAGKSCVRGEQKKKEEGTSKTAPTTALLKGPVLFYLQTQLSQARHSLDPPAKPVRSLPEPWVQKAEVEFGVCRLVQPTSG